MKATTSRGFTEKRWKEQKWRASAFILAVLMSATATQPVRADYCPVRMLDPEKFKPPVSVVVLPFGVEIASPYPEEVTKKWQSEFVDLIIKRLDRRGVSALSAADAVNAPPADLYLEGRFTRFNKGSAAGRILIATPNSQAAMELEVTVHSGEPTEPIAIFECERAAAGGPLGLGGLLAGSSKVIMHNHLETFAKNIAKTIANGGVGKRRKGRS